MPKPSFETWIAPATGKITDEDVSVVKVTNDFARHWTVELYKELIRNILKEIRGKRLIL
ncbi:DnaA N-terminal domain-containing protein [Virgibacillus sp. SK37]|uniref:DnaA N-terminal domain-containing protein n=1 Tax=Virgibacillus sp. SK37 TaxID=403957 RepID=UPI000A01858F